jgi:hypothetical protein
MPFKWFISKKKLESVLCEGSKKENKEESQKIK